MKPSSIIKTTFLALLSLVLTLCVIVIGVVVYFETTLPDITVLKDAPMQVPLMIFTSDGKLIGEFGAERRNPIPLREVPQQLINAILATEDQRFFEHSGVDPYGLLRAAMELVKTGVKSQGGSTITMQVARNYFLTDQKTYGRKFREILLAMKIDSVFGKDKILELYLNKIYFGNHAYGIAAAAQVYYGKPLNELSLPQLAMLAGLPKAPSTINPIINPVAAKERRDHVLERMYQHGYIDQQTYQMAIATPVATTFHGQSVELDAPYVAQMITDALLAHYGPEAVNSGLKVYTTINSQTQLAADQALRDALVSYDSRHGYRGSTENLGRLLNATTLNNWLSIIASKSTINGLVPAVIIRVNAQSADAMLNDGNEIQIPWQGLSWARRKLPAGGLTAYPQGASEIVKVGDVIRVIKMSDGSWRLTQIPKVEGALVALNPQNGAILALAGGFDYSSSKYNRVTQAERQPGSSFKPFVYAAALEKGYTLATVINDAPIVVWDPSIGGLWRPQNDDHKFYGPTRLRVALAQSRNLVSIRLLQDIGIGYTAHFGARFGFDPNQLPRSLSMALGTAQLTPLQMVTGYAVFANGGYRVNPYLIDHITNDFDKIFYKAQPKIACVSCIEINNAANQAGENITISDAQQAPRVISPQTAYLMDSALQDVIRNGTGTAALVLKRGDLAGKTGTSQNQVDAWFSGFNGDIVATAWVGYDHPQSLGEWGNQAALPMWIEFMGNVLRGKPANFMPTPPGIVTVRIDPMTGLLASNNQNDAIFEMFNRNYMPTQQAPMTGGANPNPPSSGGQQLAQPLF